MSKIAIVCVTCFTWLAITVEGQTARRSFVQAQGQGTVSAKPDQGTVDLAIVSQAQTAQDAANQNANQTTQVLAQLKQLLGNNADIRTLNYSLNPNYTYPPGGGQPNLIGFTANNTVEVTVGDLTLPGKVIDTAVQAGANRVESLRFSIKDDQPLRLQALRAAALQARSHADAIAQGLGMHTGAVISAAEGSGIRVLTPAVALGAAAQAPTPVQPGNVDVTATVTLEVEIMP